MDENYLHYVSTDGFTEASIVKGRTLFQVIPLPNL